jgi:hypothetical protein
MALSCWWPESAGCGRDRHVTLEAGESCHGSGHQVDHRGGLESARSPPGDFTSGAHGGGTQQQLDAAAVAGRGGGCRDARRGCRTHRRLQGRAARLQDAEAVAVAETMEGEERQGRRGGGSDLHCAAGRSHRERCRGNSRRERLLGHSSLFFSSSEQVCWRKPFHAIPRGRPRKGSWVANTRGSSPQNSVQFPGYNSEATPNGRI